MIAARQVGHRVEDTSQETAYGHTYANPDGTWTTDEYTGPVQVQDEHGAWQPIDPSLETTGDGDIKPAVSAADVVFGGGGSTTLATMTVDGKPVTWTWPTTLPTPTIDGASATYKLDDTEQLVLTATSNGFSQDMVLLKAPPSVWQMPTPTISGAAGDVGANSTMSFKTPAGKSLVTSSAPFAFDSSRDAAGEPAISPLAAKLTPITAIKQKLSLTPVASFLAAKSTVYPVTIDPSYQGSSSASLDTWIQSPDYRASQYTSPELKVGTYDGGTDVARTFLKLGNTTWTAKNITSAKLTLRNFYSSSCTGSAVRVAQVTTPWSEAGIGWGNQPSWTSTNHVDLSAAHGYNSSCAAADAVWDITGIARNWADGDPQYGVVIKAVDETDSLTWRRYRSTEYGSTVPKITFTYDSYPNTASTPSVTTSPASSAGFVNTLTPTLKTTVSDPDGELVKARFQIFKGSTLVTTTGYSTTVASGGASSTLAVPAGVLANGTTYTVKAQAYDGALYSKAWSGAATFTTAVGTPPTPTINCPNAVAGSWPDTVPSSAVACTIGVAGTGGSAPVSVAYSIDSGAWTTKSVTSPTTVSGLSVANKAGGHSIKAYVTSASGVVSATTTYSFGYGPLALNTPGSSPVLRSTGVVTIGATGPPGPSGSGLPTPYLQWRIAGSGGDASTGWTKDTAASLKTSSSADGGIALTGTWNIADVVASGTGNDSRLPHLVDLEVCATYTSGTQCSWTSHPVTVMYETHAFGSGFPTVDVPAGQVALWTGEFATSSTMRR